MSGSARAQAGWGLGAMAGPAAPPRDLALIGVAVLVSALVLWWASGQALLAAGFAAGVVLIAAGGRLALRSPSAEAADALATPDWSVTQAALDGDPAAVAITDRAGRLVCANAAFIARFGVGEAPPNVADRPEDSAFLAELSRSAWRDGQAEAPSLDFGDGIAWHIGVRRAGRGEDHFAWRFTLVADEDLVADVGVLLSGKLGLALSEAGIQAAVVDRGGAILSANDGFAHRAGVQSGAALIGSDFVSWFRSDDHDRIYYASEGRNGVPMRLVHLPIVDPADSVNPDPLTTPSLMLLLDTIGAVGEPGTATSQIEALLARLPLGLAMTDRDGRFLFANKSFLRAAGVTEEMPQFPTDLVIREDKGPLSDAVRRHAMGAPASGDLAVRLTTSPDEPVSLSLAAVRGLGEGAVLLSIKDSTEETRLKRQVAQATKMQAVGQLAGGVAHDFNNVLTAIIGYCDLMLMRHMPGDSDYDDIQQIKANSNRAAALTRQLLAFSRQQTLRPEILQLPDVVAEVSSMLKRLMGDQIAFSVVHDRDLGPVRADPVQLEHVIINLAVNARDAMQGRRDARLKIATRRVGVSEVRALANEVLPIGDYTALIVEDNGGGIPPEHIGKIFEPFFTTKDRGKGTGLGLSTVYGIVKQSGGYIFAESEPGHGARFTIYLPVYTGGAATDPVPAAVQAKPGGWSGGGRILLVEDEDTVRAVAERALARHGYTVVSAADGDEGLEAIESGEEFDLVVSDVVMPSMDGPAMVRAIRQKRPELPVLFMSGYAEAQLRREINIANMHFLPKPFSVAQIAEAVDAVLSGGKSSTN